MTDVVVIGAGKRAVGVVLPALHCLQRSFRVVGVIARSIKEIDYGAGRVTTKDSLEAVDLSKVSLVVVAVGTSQVPAVLSDLAKRRLDHAVVMLDTPVLQPAGLAATRFFSAFRRVVVSEDNIALPPFLLARGLIERGSIGALRRIYFFHNGYKHHAIASLEMLAASRIRRISDRKFAGKLRLKEIEFANGVSARMYEPRDYAIGKFLIEGESGAIADYDHAVPLTHRIGYRIDHEIYRGLVLDGAPVAGNELDEQYRALIGSSIPDASPMNTMKIRGLMDLIDGAVAEASPFHYSPEQGLGDHFSIRLADRIGTAPTPHQFARLMGLARSVARRVSR